LTSDNPPAAAPETEEEFRSRARSWLEANAPRRGDPADFSAAHLFSAESLDDYWATERAVFDQVIGWQRRLHAAGWAGMSWPSEYGGRGLPEWTDRVFAEEQARFGVSTKLLSVGLQMVASAVRVHGSPEQQLRFLAPIVRADEIWCQLFSEPDAGSDLAGIKTRAIAQPAGGWLLDGQKVWTSGAGASDLGLALVRTDPESRGRVGLSCFVVDMHSPAVEVRPLREMSGAYHFNEVFLAGVPVTRDDLIGAEGDGWVVARTVLSSERSAIGGGTSARAAGELIATARHAGCTSDPLVRQDLAAAFIREFVLDLQVQRIQAVDTGPAAGSIVKLMYSEHAGLTSRAAINLLGAGGVADGDNRAWQERFLFAPGLRLGGGSDEIQRNIIAERGLGLPRDPIAAPNPNAGASHQ
jgi:alkylation response protein AidB-like acyl-CoA dehydrogenase